MNKTIKIERFMQSLFDEKSQAKRAAEIGQAILEAGSIRLTEIAAKMRGNSEANTKRVQRFLKAADPRKILWRWFQTEADFVIGDPTEIERPQAWKTPYVGKLKDGKTRGFWAISTWSDWSKITSGRSTDHLSEGHRAVYTTTGRVWTWHAG